MCEELCYDRGNYWYCPDCGRWMEISLKDCPPGTADFEYAGDTKGFYQTKFQSVECTGIEKTEEFHCARRRPEQEIKV